MPFTALAGFFASVGPTLLSGAEAVGDLAAKGAATVGKAVADTGVALGSQVAEGGKAVANAAADFGKNVVTGFTGTEPGAGDASKKAGIIARDAQGDTQWGNTMARFAGAYARNRVEKKLKESPVLATLYAAGKEGLQ